jgi:hypothetical protein
MLWINTIGPLECALAEALAGNADQFVFDSSENPAESLKCSIS